MQAWSDEIYDYKVSDDEFKAQLALIDQLPPLQSDTKQFHNEDLSDALLHALENFFHALEAGEYDAARTVIESLYQRQEFHSKSKGLYALSIVEQGASEEVLTSVIREATPFSRIDADDWAFYLALAKIKRFCNQPIAAEYLITLAERIPYHHEAMLKRERELMITCRVQSELDGELVLPRLFTNSEEVINTFSDADELKSVVPAQIWDLDSKPELLQGRREDNQQFQRVVSRAALRHRLNDWHILDNPDPQNDSYLSTLPLEVFSIMASQLKASVVLQLASTCKLFHNCINLPDVWSYRLECRWNLDLACFGDVDPRHYKLISKQIDCLISLGPGWWKLNAAISIPNAIETVLQYTPIRFLAPTESTETAYRMMSCIVLGDRSGHLMVKMVERGILDYALNTINTDTDAKHVQLAMDLLSLFYLSNRISCALVSYFLPVPLAKVIGLSRSNTPELVESAFGLAAAASASQVLYHGAGSTAFPEVEMSKVRPVAPDFESVTNRFPFDFGSSLVDPYHAWMITPNLLLNDRLEPMLAEAVQPIMIGSIESEVLRHLDPLRFESLSTYSKLFESFATAEGEWQMYVVLPGAASENVLHRGLLCLNLSIMDEMAEGDPKVGVNGGGYWTIHADETVEGIQEASLLRNGPYVSNRTSKADEDDQTWNFSHSIEFKDATLGLATGDLYARIERNDGSSWVFSGTSFSIGYRGSIQVYSSDGSLAEDDAAGFVMLKPQWADTQLHAYERLAQLPLLIGPTAGPWSGSYPREWNDPMPGEEEDPEIGIQLEILHDVTSSLISSLVNRDTFLSVIEGSVSEGRVGPLSPLFFKLFSTDSKREIINSGWNQLRAVHASNIFRDLETIRISLVMRCRDESENDLEALAPFCEIGRPIEGLTLFEQRLQLPKGQSGLDDAHSEQWEDAIVIVYKWVSRLLLFELAGVNRLSAMQYVYLLLTSVKTLVDGWELE